VWRNTLLRRAHSNLDWHEEPGSSSSAPSGRRAIWPEWEDVIEPATREFPGSGENQYPARWRQIQLIFVNASGDEIYGTSGYGILVTLERDGGVTRFLQQITETVPLRCRKHRPLFRPPTGGPRASLSRQGRRTAHLGELVRLCCRQENVRAHYNHTSRSL
jgi:hypothetical protein